MRYRIVFDTLEARDNIDVLGQVSMQEALEARAALQRLGFGNVEAQQWDGVTLDAWGEAWTTL